MKNIVTRCDVIDDKGNIIIYGGDFLREVFEDVGCKVSSHVVIKYYGSLDDVILDKEARIGIFPRNRVFYFKSEE